MIKYKFTFKTKWLHDVMRLLIANLTTRINLNSLTGKIEISLLALKLKSVFIKSPEIVLGNLYFVIQCFISFVKIFILQKCIQGFTRVCLFVLGVSLLFLTDSSFFF